MNLNHRRVISQLAGIFPFMLPCKSKQLFFTFFNHFLLQVLLTWDLPGAGNFLLLILSDF